MPAVSSVTDEFEFGLKLKRNGNITTTLRTECCCIRDRLNGNKLCNFNSYFYSKNPSYPYLLRLTKFTITKWA